MTESLAIWKRLAAEMGEGLGFRQTGVMYLAKTQREIDGFEAWTEHSRAHQPVSYTHLTLPTSDLG